MPPSPPPCWPAPIRITRPSPRAAEQYARQYGVEFLYRDFRPNFRAGNQRARELGFYMQKYCGCVFSEQDRYQKQIDRDRVKFQEA